MKAARNKLRACVCVCVCGRGSHVNLRLESGNSRTNCGRLRLTNCLFCVTVRVSRVRISRVRVRVSVRISW